MESSAITAVSSFNLSFTYSKVCLLRLRSFIARAHLLISNSFSASMEVFSFLMRLHPNSSNLFFLSIFTFCTINSEMWSNKHQYWELYVQMVTINTCCFPPLLVPNFLFLNFLEATFKMFEGAPSIDIPGGDLFAPSDSSVFQYSRSSNIERDI